MKRTFNLFLISISIIILTLVLATFWDMLNLGQNKHALVLSIMVSFGISISGLIIGIPEIKKQKKTKTIIGIIGHVIIILFFFSMAFYSMSL